MLTAAPAAPAAAPAGPAGANTPRSLDRKRLLAEHAAFVAGLPCRNQAKYLRRRGGERLLAAHPNLQVWMSRPITDRIAEARRLQAWPFLSWCFATGRLVPELDLLAGKGKGGHFSLWARLHADDMRRVEQAAAGFDWCGEWRARITDNAFPLVCLTRSTILDRITAEDLDAVEEAIGSATMLTGIHRQHWLTQHRGVRALCYQLGLVDDPPPHPNLRRTAPAQRADRIAQPDPSPCPTCGVARPVPAETPAPATAAPVVPIPELPHDPSLRAHVQTVLTLALEVLDGRRNPAQLHALLAPAPLNYLSVAARVHRPNRVSHLHSLHVSQPADDAAEAAARVRINGQQRAVAIQFDRDDAGAWVGSALRILL